MRNGVTESGGTRSDLTSEGLLSWLPSQVGLLHPFIVRKFVALATQHDTAGLHLKVRMSVSWRYKKHIPFSGMPTNETNTNIAPCISPGKVSGTESSLGTGALDPGEALCRHGEIPPLRSFHPFAPSMDEIFDWLWTNFSSLDWPKSGRLQNLTRSRSLLHQKKQCVGAARGSWCQPGQSAPSAEDMGASAHMNVPDAQEKVRFPERYRSPYHSRPGSRGIMQWWFLWRDSA